MPVATTLIRTAYDRLRSDVLDGAWPPGSKLVLQQLKDHYDVGASPLREALNRLASEGWVVHNEQRGFSVAGASDASLRDLVRTRTAVESLALEQAIARRSPAWEESIVLAFHRLSRTPRSLREDSYEENPEWERLHRQFHRALLAGCESPLLLGFCEQLYEQAYRYRQLAARKAYRRRNERDEHEAMFQAALAGDLVRARELLAAHYERTAGFLEPAAAPEAPLRAA
jgi:DNA-binding GntR family transcriptional regulator